ncbi:MAG: hypothetical protein CM15mP58_09380 [Burkholderiaceae bacterium]|nr:MAG: hypothetical protein CM15mP58_09380 [Burkholderiaceae bacterium]
MFLMKGGKTFSGKYGQKMLHLHGGVKEVEPVKIMLDGESIIRLLTVELAS